MCDKLKYMELFLIYIITHFLADFIFQPRWMGENKSKDLMTLISHVTIYTSSMIVLTSAMNLAVYKFEWTDLLLDWSSLNVILIIFIGHFIIDVWTSKLSGRFYLKYTKTNDKKNLNYFWWIIGLDQTIHFIHLYLTFIYFVL